MLCFGLLCVKSLMPHLDRKGSRKGCRKGVLVHESGGFLCTNGSRKGLLLWFLGKMVGWFLGERGGS